MKIAFLRYPKVLYQSGQVIRGGSEIANQYIIDFLRNKGVEVIEFEPKNIDRINLIKIPAIGTPLMFQDLLNNINEINECDLVFTTNWFSSILPEIKKPIVTIFHHDAQLVLRFSKVEAVDNKEVFDKWIGRLDKFSLGRESHQELHDQIISIGEEYMANHSKKNIAVSEFLKNNLDKDYRLEKTKTEVIYNSIPRDWTEEEEDFKRDFQKEKLKIICVTRLPIDQAGIIVKGIDRLFEIFSLDKKAEKTLLASTKPDLYKQFFKEYFNEVQYVENADRAQVKMALSNSHIAIHASRCESFGLSIVEAMYMGNVPIAFPTGIVEEFIENGKNGFIVNSVEETLKIIENLNNDRQLLAKVSKNARASVLKKMSPDLIGEQYLKVIKEVI